MSQTQYLGMPTAASAVITANGTMSDIWYRFFRTLWQQVASGAPTSLTLQQVANDVIQAQNDASNAGAAVQAETERATAAEQNLQTQITNLSAQLVADVTNLQGQITGLQGQINTINQRLTNAGIP